jgi:PAS domain S-box-containing protein
MMLVLKQQSTLALLLLIAAGYLGNYFSLSLFFGVDFIFGSIAVLLVLYLFGLRWGIVAAFLTSWQTIILWNHPYALIILVSEAIFVGFFINRKSQNVLLIDVIYWLLIGMPLVWIFYAFFLNVESTQAILIVLKQSVNGIFNALISSLMVAHLPLYKWVGHPQLRKTISFEKTLLNLFVVFVFFPALMLTIFDGNRVMRNTEIRLQNELQTISSNLKADLESWYELRLRSLNEVARIAGDNPSIQRVQQSAELIDRAFPVFNTLYVTNAAGTIIASSPVTNETGGYSPGFNIANQPIFKTTKATLKPVLEDEYKGQNSFPKVDLSVPIVVNQQFQGLVAATLDVKEFSQLFKSRVEGQEVKITLIDSTDRIITSNQLDRPLMQKFDRRQNGQIKPKDGGFYQWLPPKGNLPAMVQWKKSYYVQETTLGGDIPWKVIVEIAAAPQVSYLQNIYIFDLAITLLIAGLALVSARLVSRRLVSPLAQLAQETTNLPDKILEQRPIDWLKSPVTEISSLVENFKLTSVALNQKFQEIQTANETLEQRVQERTDKLIKANKKLRNEISDRKQAEEALKKERNFISAILDTTGALVIVVNSQAQIVRFNRACEELTQYSFTEVQNKYVWDFFLTSEEVEPVKGVMQNLQAGQLSSQYENYWVAKDGSRHLIAWSNTVLLNTDGSVQYVIGSGIDITQRQEAEEALQKSEILRQQAEALEQANRIKDEFLAIVSHELRTPLNSILGWAKLLRSRKYDETTTSRALETIERNAKSQAQLIDDILDISRIVRGQIRLNLHPVNLVPIIEAAINSVLPTATAKKIQVDSQLEFVGLVSADAERLQQVVWNLLSNAIKFTPEGGQVQVQLSAVMGDGNSSFPISDYRLPITNYAEITIKDTGKGISAEFLPYVFERFRQADSSMTRTHGGLGLGLAIVRHLVELQGGIVFAESAGEGQGATFTVRLPLLERMRNEGVKNASPADSSVTHHPSPITRPLADLRVLVVDDDKDTLDFLITALAESGAQVTSATSVQDAIATLKQFTPDVLVSDIGMPQADGYSLIRQVRACQSHQVAQIPAVALTAYARDEDKKHALDAGFHMHVSKPVEPAKLIAVVAKLTGRSA